MSSDSHANITYTLMSSYEVIVNGYFRMPMDPLDPYAQLVMEAPPSPDYIPRPGAPPSPDYIPGPEYPKYLPPADDVLPAEEQQLVAAVSPTAESPGFIADSKPEMDPEEEDGDDENEEEEEEHLALIVHALALHSSISAFEDSDQTEPFEEGVTAATPPPSAYHVAARISVRPHIPMPFRSESEVERLLAIPTPSLSSVSPFLMPLPIFTPLPPPPPPPIILPRTRASIVLMRYAAPSTFILALRSRALPIWTPPQIRPALTVDDIRRAEDRLIGRLRREAKMAPKRARSTRANPDPTRTTTATEPMTQEAINNLIAQRDTEALAKYKT
nr:hypothetical protein [Tanacetum cinerariifolium]